MKIRTTKIDWDTDGEAVDLPQAVTLIIPDEDMENPTAVADALSNNFGWCVNSVEYEAVEVLQIEMRYDHEKTDAETVANVCDKLLKLAAERVPTDEYGQLEFGPFLILTPEVQIRNLLMDVEHREECTTQSALRDILTDLRHLAAERGLSFDVAIEGSRQVFEEEHEGED